MIVFKLKNRETGLYANGGLEFKQTGKYWKTQAELLDHLKHLKMIHTEISLANFLAVTDVVKIEVNELSNFSALDLINSSTHDR